MSEKFHTELKVLKQDTTGMVQFARGMLSESVTFTDPAGYRQGTPGSLEKEPYQGDYKHS